ncbi:MAG: hypothetical protein AAF846_09945 [Chloroflexota bacterium]
MKFKILLFLSIVLIVSACGTTGENDASAEAVESYLEAKINSDEDGIRNLICSELESTIELEVASFSSVEASIENMSCASDGDIVTCSGTINALYGTEEREIALSSYRVVQEDGEWRWCGEGN